MISCSQRTRLFGRGLRRRFFAVLVIIRRRDPVADHHCAAIAQPRRGYVHDMKPVGGQHGENGGQSIAWHRDQSSKAPAPEMKAAHGPWPPALCVMLPVEIARQKGEFNRFGLDVRHVDEERRGGYG